MSCTESFDRERTLTFEEQAGERRKGIVAEFAAFLAHNKKWWLAPIVCSLLLLGALVVLGGSSVAPFIYALF